MIRLLQPVVSDPDRLSSLPDELIQIIFDLVETEYQPLLILNKRLLPFYRSRLYRFLQFIHYGKLAKLVRTLLANPSLGRHIESIDVWFLFPRGMESRESYATFEIAQFAKALPTLVSLKELKIWGSSAIVRSILEQDVGIACPKLRELRLESAFRGFKHIFDRFNFVNLAGCDQLRNSVISYWGSESHEEEEHDEDENRGAEEYSDRSTLSSLSLPSPLYLPFVDDLTLRGSFSSIHAAQQILTCFRPTKLRIDPSGNSSLPLHCVLDTVPYPDNII